MPLVDVDDIIEDCMSALARFLIGSDGGVSAA